MNFIDIDLKNNICSDEYVVGYQGESYVKGIRFILPDELVNWNAFVDLENANGDKTRYEIIDKDNNVISYEFTAVDLKYSGKLTLNLVLVKDKQILKPYIAEFIVKEAICAENESSENVPIILSSNLSNEINKNIESRHEHSNMDVLDKLEESNNGNLIYNGNPIIGGSVSEECDPTVPEWAKQKEKPTYSADEISGFDEKSKELIDNSLQEAKESGLFDTELPSVTEADNGKVLRVVDGVWAADTILIEQNKSNWELITEVALDTETAKYILCSCDEYDKIEIMIKRDSNNTSLTGNMFFEIVDSNGNSVVELYSNNLPGYREKMTIMEVNSGYAHCIATTSNNIYSSNASLSRCYYVGNGCKYCLKIPKPDTACDGLSTMTVIGRRR